MPKHLIQATQQDFHWLDISQPTEEELKQIAEKYGIHSSSIQDCLDPKHLPKIEQQENVLFVITRSFDTECDLHPETAQGMTRKTALFIGKDFLVTVHRKDLGFIREAREKWLKQCDTKKKMRTHILNDLLSAVVNSYQDPIDQCGEELGNLEETAFRSKAHRSLLEEGYFLKRKISLIKKMLRMTSSVLDSLRNLESFSAPWLQHLKDSSDKLGFYADEIEENLNALLSLHFNMQSNRTNEVMRILTVISVFFMPLNFIAGVYGMNFKYMPELERSWGYPGALGLMMLIALSVLFWFKRKGWLND